MIPGLVGRLSVLGAPCPSPLLPTRGLMRGGEAERTLPIICRNLGVACPLEAEILGRQILAARQAAEIRRRVEFLPLKGLHLAHRVYPSPALRDMGDLDLLVRPGDLRAAHEALRASGYAAECDPDAVKGSLNAVLYHRDGDLPVHLHWHVSNASLPHFMYRIDSEEIWREARGGEMARHHLVVTLCEHALKHSYETLLLLADIELASRGADWRLVAEAARRWGLEEAVACALVLLRDLMGVESAGLSWVRRPRGGAGALLLRLARRRRWNGLSALGYLSMAQGVRAKARFVRESLAPRRSESEGLRSRTLGKRLWRAASMILKGVTS